MNPQSLRIPGPTPVPPEVMSAMQRPMIPHRGAEFRALHRSILEKMRWILQTESRIFLMPGSGSVGWEAAICNTLQPGDPVLAIIVGDFGRRFAAVAERFGLDVRRVERDAGQAASADLVACGLHQHPDARAVLYTHNETSTGVLSPLDGVGRVAREHGALLFVDAVSSAGAVEIPTDELEIDILFSGSQKGWMCPPGLAIVSVNDRALSAGQRATLPRSFLDFQIWSASVDAGDTPATAPLTMFFAIDAACDLILDEGMPMRTRRHESSAKHTRSLLAEAGFGLLAEAEHVASPTVTAARPPSGMMARELVNAVRERYDIEVAAGQAELSDAIIRIGHMGWFVEADIARAVNAVVACSTGYTEQSQGS